MYFNVTGNLSLREKCPYSEFLWSLFFHIRTEYGEILRIFPYSVRMQENADQETPNTDTFYAVYDPKSFKPFRAYVPMCFNIFQYFAANVPISYPLKRQKTFGFLVFSGGLLWQYLLQNTGKYWNKWEVWNEKGC